MDEQEIVVENKSLMNKTTSELTVADTLKINAVALAVIVGVPVAIGVGSAAVSAVKQKVRVWRKRPAKTDPPVEKTE